MRIKIIGMESDETYFVGTIPQLPRKGECIGFWVELEKDNEWKVAEVLELVYEFDKGHKFEMVEITVDC